MQRPMHRFMSQAAYDRRTEMGNYGVAVAGIADPDDPDDPNSDDAGVPLPNGRRPPRSPPPCENVMRLRSGRAVDRSRAPPTSRRVGRQHQVRQPRSLGWWRRGQRRGSAPSAPPSAPPIAAAVLRQVAADQDLAYARHPSVVDNYNLETIDEADEADEADDVGMLDAPDDVAPPSAYVPSSPYRITDEPWFSPDTPTHESDRRHLEQLEPPPVRRHFRFGRATWGIFAPPVDADADEPPSKRLRIAITDEASICDLPYKAREPVKLSTCAVCQEDDAPMETVFTGCGHVSTCMGCALQLIKQNNGDAFMPHGKAKCPVCRHLSVPIRIRAA